MGHLNNIACSNNCDAFLKVGPLNKHENKGPQNSLKGSMAAVTKREVLAPVLYPLSIPLVSAHQPDGLDLMLY